MPAPPVWPFGPTLDPDGVTFRAYSPGAKRVELILAPETPYERTYEMPRAEEKGFFQLRAEGVGAGTRYRLRRDERWPQADPASHFQPDGPFGPSEVIDHDAPWEHDEWAGVSARDLVLYELHVGAFTAEGTYAAARAHLPHLRDLGVTAIKLMPLASWSGGRNWGYDGVFHFAPFAGYGRPKELRRFVDACHGRGIAVLLDVVTNHFGPEGNPMWDFARPFFCDQANTSWGPGPRFEKREVLLYFEAMARHYRQRYRMDGLRLDAVHAIDRDHRRPHVAGLVSALADGGAASQRAHLFLESIENEASLLGVVDEGVSTLQLDFDFQRSLHRVVTGEAHAEYSDHEDAAGDLATCLEGGFCFTERYSHLRKRVIGEAHRELSWATLVTYLTNHDSAGNRYLGQRLQDLIDERLFRACTALLLLHPATPYLFMGQEWATRRPFFFFTEFEEALGRRVGEGRARGFHEVDVKRCQERAPHPQSLDAFTRSTLDWGEVNEPACARHLELTRALLALRKRLRPRMTETTAAVEVERAGACFTLRIAGSSPSERGFVLVANLGDEPHPLPDGELLFSSDALEDERVPPATTVLVRSSSA